MTTAPNQPPDQERTGLLTVYAEFHLSNTPPDNRRVSLGLNTEEAPLFIEGEWRDVRVPWFRKKDINDNTKIPERSKELLIAIVDINGVDDIQPESMHGFCVQYALAFKAIGGEDALLSLFRTALHEATEREIEIVRVSQFDSHADGYRVIEASH